MFHWLIIAEHKVIDARNRGINTNIYRVGNLVFNSKTLKHQPNIESNGFYNTLKTFSKLGVIFETFAIEMSCVDNAAELICGIYDKKVLQNGIYHVYSDEVVPIAKLVDQVSSAGIKVVPLSQYIDKIKIDYNHPEFRQTIANQLLHLGWLDDGVEEMTDCVVDQSFTNYILKNIRFKWQRISKYHIKHIFDNFKLKR